MSDAGGAFKTIGRTVGGVGLGLTYVNGVLEYNQTGTLRTSTSIDMTISTFLYGGSFLSGPVAPFFWGAGAIYGGVRLMWGTK